MKFLLAFLLITLPGLMAAQLQSKNEQLAHSETGNTDQRQRCGSTLQWHEQRMIEDEEYRLGIEEHQKMMQLRTHLKNPDCSSGPVIIPVAVHFDAGIVNPSEEACMINLVLDQIATLNIEINGNDPQNAAFANLANCYGQDPVEIGNSCIEFCLAISGHPPGYNIGDGDYAITFGQVNFNVTPPMSGVPIDANWAGYLNIYVDDLGGVFLGESAGIPGIFSGEGILVEACTFGSGNLNCPGVSNSASCGGIYNEGNTLIHEIGHYLGLYHIWGDGGCTADDGISDTPPMNNSYSGETSCNDTSCNQLPSSCGSNDMYMNYMSYAGDICMYMFTSEQSDVIHLTATNAGFSTSTPASCIPTAPPSSSFSISSTTLCPMGCIDFTDSSNNGPNAWNWIFTVTSGDIVLDMNSSAEQNPRVCLTAGTGGSISASLTASNGFGSGNTTTQSITITVLDSTDPQCVVACEEYAGGPYIDLLFPNQCQAGCQVTTPGFEVWENESYIVQLEQNINYTFEFCTGYNANTWPAVITVALYDGNGGVIPNTVVDAIAGCSLSFTAPINAFYIILVTGENNCGGAENQTDNGVLNFNCNNAGNCPCQTVFRDKGNGPNGNYTNDENTVYTFCPDLPNQKVEVNFIQFEIEVNAPNACYDYLEVYDGPSTGSPQLGGQFCGTSPADAPGGGTITSSDPSGCLTFEFTSDPFVTEAGWIANVDCIFVTLLAELLNFQAAPKDRGIQLEWTINSTTDLAGFEILRSRDNEELDLIDWISAQNQPGEMDRYEYLDKEVIAGNRYYYQLRQIDQNGQSSLSEIVSVTLPIVEDSQITIFPNPIHSEQLVLEFSGLSVVPHSIEIFDATGRFIDNFVREEDNMLLKIDLSGWVPGVYIIHILTGDLHIISTNKFVKL